MRSEAAFKMVRRPAVLSGILAFMTTASLGGSSEDVGLLPKFIENVPNITVTVGRDALLPCTVEELRGFKVAWVQVDTQTILTIHKHVITRNPRIALLHNDHRTWHLQIKNVRESDRGWYMCQVNTDPMRYRQGYVDVVVPPDIIDRESSGDLTIREGLDVTLNCRAKGHPPPTIVWRREDNQDIFLDPANTGRGVGLIEPPSARGATRVLGPPRGGVGADGSSGSLVGVGRSPGRVVGVDVGVSKRMVEGETLVLKKVSRLQMGSYLCIASNGIPPSISKRAYLSVQFPPMTWVPQQLEGAYVGQDLTIECRTEAYPRSINYWTNTRGDMIVAGERYEPIIAEISYKVDMKLRIRSLAPDDFGTFHCVAKNSLGETDGAIRVYEIEPPKSHVNGGSGAEEEQEEEEAKGENSGEPPPSAPTHSKEHKKYQNFIHPKGVNDFTDQQHLDKSYSAKGEGKRGTNSHQLPMDSVDSSEQDTAGACCPSRHFASAVTLPQLLVVSLMVVAAHVALLRPPLTLL